MYITIFLFLLNYPKGCLNKKPLSNKIVGERVRRCSRPFSFHLLPLLVFPTSCPEVLWG